MSTPPPIVTAANLIPGVTYRVIAPFTDYDGNIHPAGETWKFISKNFMPFDDGLTLFIEQNGQPGSIRLQWQEAAQAHIIEQFARYVETAEKIGGYSGQIAI
jgi:hypothetical protein